MRILVTRPAGDAERTAAALRALGHEPVVAPLAAIRFADPPAARPPPAALLVTSANAVRGMAAWGVPGAWRTARVLAVGDRSAAAARQAGFAEVVSAKGDAAALAGLAARTLAPGQGPVLWPAAAEPAADLVALLAPAGIRVERIEAYRMVAVPALPDGVAAGLRDGAIGGVLLYSPRSAREFVRLCRAAGLSGCGVTLFALAPAVAEAVAPLAAADIRVAAAPNEPALLALLPGAVRT